MFKRFILCLLFIFSLQIPAQAGTVAIADIHTEIAKGNITGHASVHKFGFNGAVGTTEVDITNFGNITWLTSASTLEAISDSANDDSDGVGARTIYLEGLDINYVALTETIIMNGTSATTATTGSFIRLNRAYVVTCGTYTGTNDGDITIRVSGAGATMGFIETDEGQTQQSNYTVAAGKTIQISRMAITMQTNKEVTVTLVKRENADDIVAPFTAKRLMHEWTGISTPVGEPLKANHIITEKSDVWLTGLVSTGTAVIEVDYDILVIDNIP
jgi:hypothetical protein